MHGHVRLGLLLVEAAGQDAVVLEVLHGVEQPGGDMALAVAQDCFVDLHLVRLFDRQVVRLEARGILVIVVARDLSVRADGAAFENDRAVAVPDHDMQPGTPRGIGGGQLVAREILDGDRGLHHPILHLNVADGELGGVLLDVGARAGGRAVEILRQGRHREAEQLEHGGHEEVAAEKFVAGEPGARLGEQIGDGRGIARFGHVAARA